MSTDAVLRELLVRQLDHWLPGALQRSRRATLALSYAGEPATAEAALRVVAEFADRLRGRRLTVLVLAGGADLPARLGAVEATLPADVAVHLVPGDPARLPVALKAAGAAGAPLLTVVDGVVPGPAVLDAAATGRPAEVLAVAPAPATLRPALDAAGFPLVTEVELVPADGGAGRVVAYGTRLDRSLEAFKDALWDADEFAGVRYRDPADPAGGLLDIALHPEPGPLRRELLAELARSGPRTVTELRRHTLTATAYRAADTVRALSTLLTSGAVTREPEHGRLGGDVLISAAPGGPSAA
ncbi:hypothetical protein V6U81_05915 [Micromonospora sp. CPCC 205711]|uniref:hypothetical protein n=1 Tax=Micromonospora sp. CPCC 205547 TaxID=3122400 RepID=UPI002FF01619